MKKKLRAKSSRASKALAVVAADHALVGEAIGLADMNSVQMGAAIAGLRNLETKHENLSGICAALIGIVLHEAKRRLAHGKFMPFVGEHFAKSHRSANAYMRVGQRCLEAKLESTFQFEKGGGKRADAFALLTNDLATSLRELEQFQLDLQHPVVSHVARWVNGRGSYQLMLDYPSGYDRAVRGKGKTGITAQSPLAQAEEILLPAVRDFVSRWRQGLWVHLPHSILSHIDGDLLDIRRQIKKALEK